MLNMCSGEVCPRLRSVSELSLSSSNVKPAISLKRGKIGPRLLWMTNRKLHYALSIGTEINDLIDYFERPFRILFQNACVFGAHHEKLNEDRHIRSAAKMQHHE